MGADASRLRNSLRSWSGNVTAAWTEELAEAMRPEAPISTPTPTSTRAPGELRRSIRAEPVPSFGLSSYRGRLVAPVIQAATTAGGARAHIIRPVRAKRLRFYSAKAGAIVFAREVNHPGNTGTDWWQLGLRRQAQRALSTAARRTPWR